MKIFVKLITGLVAAMLMVPAAWGGSVTIPNTFTSGTPAVAAEVNQNFDAVATAVNDNDSRVTTNTVNINTNTTNIGNNAANIATNANDISTNANDISTNANNMTTHSGDPSAHHARYTDGEAVSAVQAAGFVENSGVIRITSSFGSWVEFTSSDPVDMTYYSGRLLVSRTSTGNNFFSLHPDIPVALYGQSLELTGVEFCYDVSATGVSFNRIEINTFTHDVVNGSGSVTHELIDNTIRNDATCRTYTLTTPVTLTSDMGVNVFVRFNWATAGVTAEIGRTSFLLSPTNVAAAVARQTIRDVKPSLAGESATNP